jgi:hypothetical protein
MTNRVSHSLFCWLLACMSFICIPAAHAQQAELLNLRQGQPSYAPTGFYIDKVVDDRKQTASIGTAKKGTPIVIKDGAAAALMQFIERNIKQDKSKTPLTLHITKFNVRVRQAGRVWLTETDVLFTFYFGDMRIVPLGSTGNAQSGEYTMKYAEELMSKSIGNALKSFDKWWAENKSLVPLSKSISINVSIARTCDKEGLIVYTPGHPLRIADFKAPSLPKKLKGILPPDAAACTSSSIEKMTRMDVRESRHTLDIVLTPVFDMQESWFKSDVTSRQVLAHEQTHFDLTALKTCELANALKSLALTSENYQALLNETFNKYDAEWRQQEDEYDEETDHGTLEEKQLSWQQKVSEKLKQAGCY